MKKLYLFALLLLGAIMPLSAMIDGAWIKTDKFCYKEGETIKITFDGARVGVNDWVAVFRAQAYPVDYYHPEGSWIYKYSDECTDGTMILVNGIYKDNLSLPEGSWVAMLLANDGYDRLCPAAGFIVTNDKYDEANPPAVSVDKTAYGVYEPITLTFENLPIFPNDWATVVRRITDPSYDCWWDYNYIKNSKDGKTITLNSSENFKYNGVTELPVDVYYVSVMADDGYCQLARSKCFAVGEPVTVSTAKSEYKAGEAVEVNYTKAGAFDDLKTDKIAIFDKDNKQVAEKVIDRTTQNAAFTDLTAGDYTASYTDGEGLELSPRVSFAVADNSGVEDIVVDSNAPAVIYNLQGVKMNTTADNLPGGVYIINGKKVLVK